MSGQEEQRKPYDYFAPAPRTEQRGQHVIVYRDDRRDGRRPRGYGRGRYERDGERRDYPPRDNDRNDYPPRSYDRRGYPPRDYERRDYRPRDYDRRPPRDYERRIDRRPRRFMRGDSEALRQAVQDVGQDWRKVGERLGLNPYDCARQWLFWES